MSALGDLARSRILVLLEQGELTVSELVRIVQLPQSTVSRHLKVLADDGWVTSRASGTSRHYSMSTSLDREAQELWSLVRLDVVSAGHTKGDAERAIAVLAQRRQKSRAFFASAADRWDGLRDELFGAGTDALPFIGFLDRRWIVGDLGTGTGQFAAHVAPFVRRVVAVDASPEMREAARARLQPFPNTEVRAGELENLTVADGELDVAVLLLVLHYIVDPLRALAEAARTLAPGGRLITVDMRPHTREGYREEMGHVWPGFDETSMSLWHRQVGLGDFQYQPLPAQPEATGPLLFVASATKPQ